MEKRKITIEDVAAALNVSTTTVSRAISGKGRVGEATKKRVLEYIEKNHFVPSVMAKGLAQSKTYNIGLTMPEDSSFAELPFFQQCMAGVCECAGKVDYDVVITMTSFDDNSQLERLIRNQKVDGVIVSRTLTNGGPVPVLKKAGIPFVAIGASEDNSVVRVDNDHKAACHELTATLIRKGIKRIALLCGDPTHMVSKSRLEGFTEAMSEAKLEEDMLIFEADNEEKTEAGIQKALDEKAECIICMDDFICMKVFDILKKKHIKVPADIKVASFYSSSILERNTPTVTSLMFDAHKTGEVACSTLLDLIEDKEVKNSLLSYKISMGESTE